MDSASLCLRTRARITRCINPIQIGVLAGFHRKRLALSIGYNWVGSTWGRRQNPVSETPFFKYKTGRWIISRNVIVNVISNANFSSAYWRISLASQVLQRRPWLHATDICALWRTGSSCYSNATYTAWIMGEWRKDTLIDQLQDKNTTQYRWELVLENMKNCVCWSQNLKGQKEEVNGIMTDLSVGSSTALWPRKICLSSIPVYGKNFLLIFLKIFLKKGVCVPKDAIIMLSLSCSHESYSRNRPWRPIGLWGVTDPKLYRQSGSQMAVRLSALRTGRTLLPRNIIFLILVLISFRSRVIPRA
jgi:hypothetical protein